MVYNRFKRWAYAGIRAQIMDAAADARNGDVVMIDGINVRVYHTAAMLKTKLSLG